MIQPETQKMVENASNHRRIVIGDIEIEEQTDKDETTWKSCCLTIDRDFTQFFVRYSIIVGMLIYGSYNLAVSKECQDKNLYQSLIMFCLGLAVPSPTSSLNQHKK